jgi:hypothetical protein
VVEDRGWLVSIYRSRVVALHSSLSIQFHFNIQYEHTHLLLITVYFSSASFFFGEGVSLYVPLSASSAARPPKKTRTRPVPFFYAVFGAQALGTALPGRWRKPLPKKSTSDLTHLCGLHGASFFLMSCRSLVAHGIYRVVRNNSLDYISAETTSAVLLVVVVHGRGARIEDG